ncbi:MAG: glycosyltransferase family 4 protein [Candidatus Cloacimonetes bacterium]|nr:glycosyltransferase family 4 protein [Candidatus Cloacimonadota bacterium]
MKIAIVSHSYPLPGSNNAAEFVHGFAKGLQKIGHDIFVVAPLCRNHEIIEEFEGIRIYPYRSYDSVSFGRADNDYISKPRLSVLRSLLNGYKVLSRLVTSNKIEIVHAHWTIPMGYIAGWIKQLKNIPLVITMHGRDVYYNPASGFIVPGLWYIRPFLRSAFNRADYLIAISNDCKQHAVNSGAPEHKIKIIYNGTDTDRFFPDKLRGNAIKKKHDIGKKAKLLLTVRSLNYRKGIDILIKAMPDILKAVPDSFLIVGGDGPEKANLKTLVSELGIDKRIIFTGHIPNKVLVDYYNACDIFIIPSREEGFGIAAAEAMACGVPVIGTKAGGLVETIQDGITGLLVESEDVNNLSKAVIKLLSKKAEAERMGRNGLSRIRKEFNWCNVAKQTELLYIKALSGK